MINKLDNLVEAAQKQTKMKLAVAVAQDKDILISVSEAQGLGIIDAILIGNKEEILDIADEFKIKLGDTKIIEILNTAEATKQAVKMVSEGEADFLMKGKVDTSILLKAVLDKDFGLRTGRLLSHIMVYEMNSYHKLLFLTDGGMNIQPAIENKKAIIKNAIIAAQGLGNKEIKIACLAAKEKVSSKMQATVDGAELKRLSEENYFGDGVIVEGPIAFDLAISKEAAKIKAYTSPVVGETDIILVPTIEVGNGVGKALTYMAGAKSAGVIMGAKAPVVLTSRADSSETKLYSIALGSVIAANM
ncbi:MAG: bifunctional enoyl-CoA hydratase/phosphate acetyltransferase [Clostridiales bacterium]|nr:bifunctional enoyl-CoA hydratase/phosphate acetyltransferase [Clostridiales bacterium]